MSADLDLRLGSRLGSRSRSGSSSKVRFRVRVRLNKDAQTNAGHTPLLLACEVRGLELELGLRLG